MDKREEYARNLMNMKRCNKAYNTVAIIYIVVFGFIMCEAFAGSFLAQEGLGIFGVALVCAAAIVLGFMGTYLKKNKFAIAAPLVLLLAGLIGLMPLPLVLLSAVLAALTFMTNKKYEELSHEEGFPMFSYHLKEYEEKKARNEIKTEYQERYEYYTNNSQKDMDEFPDMSSETIQQKAAVKNDYMDEL